MFRREARDIVGLSATVFLDHVHICGWWSLNTPVESCAA